jgi:hypothetical protein
MRKAKGSAKPRKPSKAKTAAKARQPPAQKNVKVADVESPQNSMMPHVFARPLQSPPAGREYLRALVGRRANPGLDAVGSRVRSKNDDQQPDNYFIQLSTFHIRNRGF